MGPYVIRPPKLHRGMQQAPGRALVGEPSDEPIGPAPEVRLPDIPPVPGLAPEDRAAPSPSQSPSTAWGPISAPEQAVERSLKPPLRSLP
jgi:hypothetical protein